MESSILARVATGTRPLELAKNIADSYITVTEQWNKPSTISIVDLSKALALWNAVDALVMALQNNLSTNLSQLLQVRNMAQKLDSQDYYKLTYKDEYVDLVHLCEGFKFAFGNTSAIGLAAQNVINTIIGNLVTYERHRSATVLSADGEENFIILDNNHGISIYFPSTSYAYDFPNYITNQLFQSMADGKWGVSLSEYFAMRGLPYEPPVDPGLPPLGGAPDLRLYFPFVSVNANRNVGIKTFKRFYSKKECSQ
jgi:hypothetical protein